MFKRKNKEIGIDTQLRYVIKILSELEPEKMDRIITLAKKVRQLNQKIDCFVNGKLDEVDRITKDMEE